MKVATIIGARPQFIKAAAVSYGLRQDHTEIIIHTGQHYDYNMSEIFFKELSIPAPDYHLGVGSLSHGAMTGRLLEKIEEVLLSEQPDAVLVYGDTNSTLAGALAASKLHIPVLHIEAGLRSYNRRMPEEQNRVLTDHVSDFLFCPTETAAKQLASEGIRDGVFIVGDVMYDAVLRNLEIAEKKQSFQKYVKELEPIGMDRLEAVPGEYYLATIHRAENTDDIARLRAILNGLSSLSLPVIMPIHPRTRKLISERRLKTDNIRFVEPIGYLAMLMMTKNAKKVITDSGGLQKEAYFLKTPCVTVREQTEWVETLEDGWNVLCSADAERIKSCCEQGFHPQTPQNPSAFGDGNAAGKIGKILKKGIKPIKGMLKGTAEHE